MNWSEEITALIAATRGRGRGRKMSQPEIARLTGYSKRAVQSWILGKREPVGPVKEFIRDKLQKFSKTHP